MGLIFRNNIICTIIALISLSISPNTARALDKIDKEAVRIFPEIIEYIVKTTAPDSQGLMGRNHSWKKLYAARFQMNAGYGLRIAHAYKSEKYIKDFSKALVLPFKFLEKHNYLPEEIPVNVLGKGKNLSPILKHSANAFFLSDVCSALLVYKKYSKQELIDTNLIKVAIDQLLKAKKELLKYDEHAPNRLLFDGMAFYSCGKLLEYQDSIESADEFISKAIFLIQSDGSFLEGNGSDTSYHSVATRLSIELAALGYSKYNIIEKSKKALNWLADHVDENGRLDSSKNTRTCNERESFIKRKKDVDIRNVIRALIYGNILFKNEQSFIAAKNIGHRMKEKGRNYKTCE